MQGKDHMQEHVIPIPQAKVAKALQIFMQAAEANKLRFSEIQVRTAQ